MQLSPTVLNRERKMDTLEKRWGRRGKQTRQKKRCRWRKWKKRWGRQSGEENGGTWCLKCLDELSPYLCLLVFMSCYCEMLKGFFFDVEFELFRWMWIWKGGAACTRVPVIVKKKCSLTSSFKEPERVRTSCVNAPQSHWILSDLDQFKVCSSKLSMCMYIYINFS